MKTLLLFLDNDGAHFFDLEGDFSRFHGVYINTCLPEDSPHSEEEYAALQLELFELMFYAENHEQEGELKITECAIPTKDWTHYALCGLVEDDDDFESGESGESATVQ